MLGSDIEVHIQNEPWSHRTSITFTQVRNGKQYVAKPVNLLWREIEGYESFTGTLVLNQEVATDLLKGMSEALDKRGIKTESDHKIQGTLEATRYHLEDTRALLGLTKADSSLQEF